MNRGSLTSRTIGGLEIIDPTTDAVVFGDANLSFALNLARHRCLAPFDKDLGKSGVEVDDEIQRYRKIRRNMKTHENTQFIYKYTYVLVRV